MASPTDILTSNAHVSSPPRPVAVFVGATSGIGAATLKAFAKYTRRPRAYFVGRSTAAADLLVAECQALNAGGEYIFVQADVALIRVVDEVCAEIKAKETQLNILFLSQGVVSLDRSETSENLHLLTALLHYSRLRFITQLLPLLQEAPSPRRVVTVASGGFEGPLDPSDLPASRIPLSQLRGHISTLITFSLEAAAKQAPSVSFIHSYPGSVNTPLARAMLGRSDAPTDVPVPEEWMSPEESGERHFNLLTVARYPAAEDPSLTGTDDLARGTDGVVGSGVYSVGWDGENALSPEALEFLAGLRRHGMVERVWEHTEGEFQRIAGKD
ncbi:uncharacterized protein BJX67DRAFT_389696 [Aspergillus lucknowensis]|uniref:Short-chain dehydrogenases/reductase n=1 Tax=Aspergillus lucknowensis TaxID=176173 RepID=A0ABR4LJV7_9EURO